MKTETLAQKLIEAITILKLIKQRNILENKDIDLFLENVSKSLGEDEKKEEEEKKKSPIEKDVEKKKERDAKEKAEMEAAMKKTYEKLEELSRLEEEKRKEATLGKMDMGKIEGGKIGGEVFPSLPKVVTAGTATSEPMKITLVEGTGAIGSVTGTGGGTAVEMDGEAFASPESSKGGSGAKGTVIPKGKVWCTTCEEYHEA